MTQHMINHQTNIEGVSVKWYMSLDKREKSQWNFRKVLVEIAQSTLPHFFHVFRTHLIILFSMNTSKKEIAFYNKNQLQVSYIAN